MRKKTAFELTQMPRVEKVKDALNLWRQGKLYSTLMKMGYDARRSKDLCNAIIRRYGDRVW